MCVILCYFTIIFTVYNCIVIQADCIATVHVGEIINSLEKATLIPGGSEAIIYTTLSGTVGMLAPFSSREVCVCDCMIISHSHLFPNTGY